MSDGSLAVLCQTPLGPLGADARNGQITHLRWGPGQLTSGPLFDRLRDEINAYFNGDLTQFTVPLAVTGTPFQRAFLQALIDIPFGETRTYGDLAAELSVSAQAIGQACGANPVPILIPCHRVLGQGSLGGFSGPRGIEDKVTLLRLERAAGLLI